MYKLVIFDLDDCLIDTWGASFPDSIGSAIRAMIDKGLKISDFDREVERLDRLNRISKDSTTAITSYLCEIGESVGAYIESGKRAIHYFDLEDKIMPLPGVLKVIRELKELGICLMIVTRGQMKRQTRKMRYAGIDPNKFKEIFAVEDYDKTGPYLEILNKWKYLPEEVLVVGDRYMTDLIPASKLGMKTAWIPWGRGKLFVPEKGKIDHKLNNLEEIIEIVRRV